MKKISVILIILAVSLIIAGGVAYTQNGEKKAHPENIKIGVIDLNEISDKYEKHNVEIEKMRGKAEAIQDELNKLTEKIKGLLERRELFEVDSDEYEDINLQIEEFKLKANVKLQTERKKIERKQIGMVKTLYTSIREAVKMFSEKNGFDLVLVKLGDQLMAKKLQDIFMEIRMKPVVYSSEQIDITDQIIEYMNTEYKK